MQTEAEVQPAVASYLCAEKAIQAYIRDRLDSECLARGASTALHDTTGLSTATIANVRSGQRGAGRKTQRVLAAYWGMTMGQLEETACRWAEEQASEQPAA